MSEPTKMMTKVISEMTLKEKEFAYKNILNVIRCNLGILAVLSASLGNGFHDKIMDLHSKIGTEFRKL